METIKGKCKYYGGDAKDSGYGPQVSACFTTSSGDIWVNVKEENADEVRLLRSLQKGQDYTLVQKGISRSGKPYYGVLPPDTQTQSSTATQSNPPADRGRMTVEDVFVLGRRCLQESFDAWKDLCYGDETLAVSTEDIRAYAIGLLIQCDRHGLYPDHSQDDKVAAALKWLESDHDVGALFATARKAASEFTGKNRMRIVTKCIENSLPLIGDSRRQTLEKTVKDLAEYINGDLQERIDEVLSSSDAPW